MAEVELVEEILEKKREQKYNGLKVESMKLEIPKPNQVYYKLYFFIGLLLHPRRLMNLIKFKLNRFNPVVNYHPTIMDIEPTQRCNYRCIMCIRFPEQKKDMMFEEFKEIIDKQYGLMEIKIQGVGEPLLNKDFFKMLYYAKKKILWVRTTTNGSLLHLNDNYKRLVDSKIHDINISIDGTSKDVYESIRIGGNFERIIENCKLINTYNNKVRKTIVRAWVVLQQKNKHQLFDFPHFFSKLGFKEICYSFAMHNYGREGENKQATTLNYSNEQFKKLFQICDNLKIKPTFFFHPHFNDKAFCQIPFKRFYITTDKHILPCCYIANQEVADFGHYDNFKEIWFDKYVKFRNGLKNKNSLPHFCKQCYGGN